MPEVIGLCIYVDDDNMIIQDRDDDRIEMIHSGIGEKIIKQLKTYLGKEIQYLYDEAGLRIASLEKTEYVEPVAKNEGNLSQDKYFLLADEARFQLHEKKKYEHIKIIYDLELQKIKNEKRKNDLFENLRK